MGFLPEPHNSTVHKLLFLLAHWHGLAKLRMHTDDTLEILEGVSGRLGNQLRMFAYETCAAFSTRELRREAESRRRRQVREGGDGTSQNQKTSVTTAGGRRPKLLNLRTYKLHALGDYPAQIRMYGTTDSYSTQSVSCHTFILSCNCLYPAPRGSSNTGLASVVSCERTIRHLFLNWLLSSVVKLGFNAFGCDRKC